MRVGAIICAAGQGRRMGLGQNKQFLELQGKPLLAHTLEVWQLSDLIDDIVVVVGDGEVATVEKLIKTYGLYKANQVVVGGQERQDSVYRGLAALDTENRPDIIVIHDGARPFVTNEAITMTIKKAREHQAAVLAVPVKDTTKLVSSKGVVEKTLERSTLWSIQTPQAFSYSLIYQAYQRAERCQFRGTDDASLVEQLGVNVHVVQGSYNNIKLTTPEDIDLAEYLMRRRREE